jgi:hypothetical protein
LEKHKRKPEALRGWCIYWTVMALYTAGTQVSDRFVFWLPMYSEAKVAFVVYLWHPRTQGALYVYDAFVAPFLAKHETAIDRHIDETRVSVGDVVARRARATSSSLRARSLRRRSRRCRRARRGDRGVGSARGAPRRRRRWRTPGDRSRTKRATRKGGRSSAFRARSGQVARASSARRRDTG